MRSLQVVFLGLTLAAPAFGQMPPTIGPRFAESAINRALFDATFEMRVVLIPAAPLFIGQTSDARFDVVVCNANTAGSGWVKAEKTARFGVLEPGECTMFANVTNLDLTTPADNSEWTAKVYLRARR